MENTLKRALDKAWGSTCRVLFGQELGELEEYGDWLGEYLPKTTKRKSHVSGKEVILAKDAYPTEARFISADELAMNKSYALDINQIKDIDSLIEALQEKCEYTGNRALGNSAFVESSDIILDSQYVYNSTNVEQSSYIYSSYMMRRGSKNVFGSGWTANGDFLVRVIAGINLHRCFESHFVSDSGDLYFCFNCDACHDALFSFGQKNKHRIIGNLTLQKDKYAQLKAKLLAEVVERLKKQKKFASLYGLVPDKAPASLPHIGLGHGKEETSMGTIETAFSSTFEIIMKRKSPGIGALEGWLSEDTIELEEVKTPFGDETYAPLNFGVVSDMPRKRLVTTDESFELGKISLDEKSLSSLDLLIDSLDKIAFFCAGYSQGHNLNIIKSPLILHSINVYKGYESTYSENTGLTSLSLHSKYVYGCNRIIDSQFCLKCHNSLYLNRCLELDASLKCSDSYFCHNCEGLSDAMFCFNVKGKRHIIGNTELPKEKYLEIKEALLGQLNDELEKSKTLGRSIFSIGSLK
ncbi:MAG: zinc ribbon domain-containing protein [Candidatus Micrarchaeota archaeon]